MQKPGWIVDTQPDVELIQINEYLVGMKRAPIINVTGLDEGRLFFLKQYNQKLNSFYEKLRFLIVEDKDFRLVWQNDNLLDAAALAGGIIDLNLILISIGSQHVLTRMFYELFASPTFCPDIGKVNLETRRRKIIVGNRTIHSEGDRAPIIPRCQDRLVIAGFIASLAIEFLFLHEFTHIVNGHNGHGQMINESRRSSDLDERIKDHTLEMDADAGATNRCMEVLLGGAFSERSVDNLDENSKMLLAITHRCLGNGPKAAARALMLATTGLFLLFESGILNEDNMFDGAHPHAIIRQVMIRGVIGVKLSKMYNQEIADNITQGLDAIHLDFYREMEFSGNFKNSAKSVDIFMNSGLYYKYVDVLADCWKNDLYDVLTSRKLFKFDLAPPIGRQYNK
ncbi:Hypothetical protein RMHFA_05793 [Roseomonas mucosa]|nr:hypothetical protein [Roseomonas sp. FDAARGOS_362]UZO95054.1 Hypothetical protein RMHFA_05793 [Roseomonas mucosa]